MHCNLLGLSAELQLMIIENLLRDGTKTDLINWSSTSSYFRNLLAPNIFDSDIFKTLELSDDENNASSLITVANSPYNVDVKELHFTSFKSVNFLDCEAILPRSVDALLCDLRRFPSLETLGINLGPMFFSMRRSKDILRDEVETPEQVLRAEASAPWRALMSRIYSALAQNKSHHVKHFELIYLIWKTVSAFSDPAFHDFLSHIERFRIHICNRYYCKRYPDQLQGYATFMQELDEYFFNHLGNVTSLSIDAPPDGYLGLEGLNHAPLALHSGQMPLLKTLDLRNIIVCAELIDFLDGHNHILEEVELHDCYASPGGNTKIGIYWSQLFTCLSSAGRHSKIRRFELEVDCAISLPCGEDWVGQEDRYSAHERPDEVCEAHTILVQDPRRRLFPYGILNYDDGYLLPDQEVNSAAFWKGEDQASWDLLMEVVERNAKEATKE